MRKYIILIIVILAAGGVWYYFLQNKEAETGGLVTYVDRQIPLEHETRLRQQIEETRARIGDRTGENKSMEDLDRWIALGNIYYILGDLAQARENTLEALDLNPVNYVAWSNLGAVLAEMKDLNGARQAYQKAVEHSNLNQYVIKYADFLRQYYPDETEEYERVLQNAVAARGQQAELISRLADFYMESGRYEEAVTHYEVLVGLAPDKGIFRDLERARKALAESQNQTSDEVGASNE